MGLEVIGAGLGRNATLSMKFALEKLGFGKCHHMIEVMANARRQIPLWLDAGAGRPDWEAIFAGYRSCTDYPSASHWRALSNRYPQAKVVLTTRNPDDWFDSVSETIFSPRMTDGLEGSPMAQLMADNIFAAFGAGDITDRAFMTEWYVRRNQEVVDTIPADRLLQFHPRDGWPRLCGFLGVPVPEVPFPRVNSRDELGAASDEAGGLPSEPQAVERWAQAYIDAMREKAFA